jgi:hypothetical protein
MGWLRDEVACAAVGADAGHGQPGQLAQFRLAVAVAVDR